MTPVKTYLKTDYVFYQCDGRTHFVVSRDTGNSITLGVCDNELCDNKIVSFRKV